MKTSLHRIYTEDGLELHGVLYAPDAGTKKVLVHVHGMGGNFYENKYPDALAKTLTDAGFAFCTFNNRGTEMIKETYRVAEDGSQEIVRVGTAYEKFADSVLDIDASFDFAQKQGFEEIHLSGHSLGAPKAAYYLAKRSDASIRSVLFLSPADMLGLVRADTKRFEQDIAEATQMASEGRGEDLLPRWVWGEYPISARTYLDLFADDSEAAIFNFYNPNDPLELLGKIRIPAFAVMGRKDDALVIPIEDTFNRLEQALTASPKVETRILGDADHGYRGDEQALADVVRAWLVSAPTQGAAN